MSNDYFNNQLNAANYGLNASKAALEAQLNAANATGTFGNGAPTYAAQQDVRQILAASGQALLEKGIIPTAEQLQAMGMTAEQASKLSALSGADRGSGSMFGGAGGSFNDYILGAGVSPSGGMNYSGGGFSPGVMAAHDGSMGSTGSVVGTERSSNTAQALGGSNIMSQLNGTVPATASSASDILSQLNGATSQSTPGSATRFSQLNNTYSEPNVTGIQGGRIVRNR